MTCFSPNQGYETSLLTVNGLRGFTYSRRHARYSLGKPVLRTVPCRKCEGCRFDYSREWAVKIMFEAQMTNELVGQNCSFITLTYNDDFIPLYGDLDYFGDWTKFLKRFRKAIEPRKVRFYLIGEYGDLNLRPHYHAIIFGFDFPDKFEHIARGDNVIYRSKFLESLWTVPRGQPGAGLSLGYSSIGDVSFASAAYVARYSMKKKIGAQTDGFEEYITDEGLVMLRPKPTQRYVRYDQETGDRIIVNCERALMSNGGGSGTGGIGKSWFDKYNHDMYRKIDVSPFQPLLIDSYNHPNGNVIRPPKYFDKLLDRVNPEMLESIKQSRQDHMNKHAHMFTPDLLRQRRECLLAKLKLLKRSIRNVYAK